MDSFTFNKMAGAVLGTLLFLMGIGIFSDAVFSVHKPEKAGYALPDATADAGGHGGAAAPKEAAVPIGELLAKADPKKGETAVATCKACHAFEKGGANKIGPALYGVVNRPIASHEGFAYSSTLKEKAAADKTWTFEHLQSFIANPKSYASNTKMAFAGEKNAQKLADIIAYLNTLSDNPAPLPK